MDTATENKNTDGTQLDEQKIAEFGNQIWCTRVSRVNAEKRLKHKEAFADGLNIYYSCFTVALSICLLFIQDESLNKPLSAFSLIMTVIVTICILYCKSLRYADRARGYKDNYTDLQQLEISLKHITSIEELTKIENEYCNLLKNGENHIPYDYYRTVFESNQSYKKTKDKWIPVKYCLKTLERYVIETVLITFPVLVCVYFWVKRYG